MRPTSWVFVLLAACGGGTASSGGPSSSATSMATLPPRETSAVLAGPLCGEETCRCANDPSEVGRPEAGFKRFEVRLGPASHELWATIDGMVLYKDRETSTDCFYVDLRPGVFPASIRGQSDDSLGMQVRISEQGGAADEFWSYGTFSLICGAPGICDAAELEAFERGLAGKHGKLDPCGSTKVRNVKWSSSKAPDHLDNTDLEIKLDLEVYKFEPTHPPGATDCSAE